MIDGDDIWVATNGGLNRIYQFDFAAQTFRIERFNRADGFITDEIEAIALRDGRLAIATNKGGMTVAVKDLVSREQSPDVYVTRIIVNEEAAALQAEYDLKASQNNLRIHFVGLSYNAARSLTFRYRLHGYDENWVTTQALETRYSNLPPGAYTFELMAIGDRENRGILQQPVTFRIRPEFWQTAWFKWAAWGVLLLGVLAAVYFIYTYAQRNHLRKLVAVRTRALDEKVKALAEANAKLEGSNAELADFAHVASHDLKSPLRNVAGFVQLLQRRASARLEPDELEYIDYAVRGVKEMEMIINDLLALSKVTQKEQEREMVDFNAVAREVIQSKALQIEAAGASVAVIAPLPELYFSRVNARQLLQNLISNAIKYQGDLPPRVRISCTAKGGCWEFSVADNGIGIAPAYHEKVFELFRRLHTRDEYPGTGVGLSICKKIVEANGGSIWLESTVGEGTTFYFTLPRTEAAG